MYAAVSPRRVQRGDAQFINGPLVLSAAGSLKPVARSPIPVMAVTRVSRQSVNDKTYLPHGRPISQFPNTGSFPYVDSF